MKTNKISNTFYVMRFFAIVAIVLAHSAFEQIPNDIAVKLLHAIGRSGVIIFFVASGYYFNNFKYPNVNQMLKSKIVTIFVPWFIWGVAAYCVRFANEAFYFNPIEIITWVLGFGTYLWFLTILIIIYCIFQVVPNNNYIWYGSMITSAVSIMLTANNIGFFNAFNIDQIYGGVKTIYLDTYLNVFNWIGFFSLGILLKKAKTLEKYGTLAYGKKKWLVLILIPFIFIMILLEKQASYWTYYSIFIEMGIFVIVLILSISMNEVKLFKRIGTISLPIYLLHMQIQGFIFNKIYPQSIIMGIIRPIITVLSVYYLINFGLYVSKKIHMEKLYRIILGLKL